MGIIVTWFSRLAEITVKVKGLPFFTGGAKHPVAHDIDIFSIAIAPGIMGII